MARKVTPVKTQQNPSTKKLGLVGLKAFFAIADESWGLTTRQQRTLLGEIPESTFYEWKKNPEREISRDTLERISYILGIYKNLELLLGDKQHAHSWVKRTNEAFNGASALDVMLQGNVYDLARVRYYLDAERG